MGTGSVGSVIWPWVEADGDATCIGALEDLHRAGVIAPSDVGWLKAALKQGFAEPPGVATPWAAWASRIGARVRLPLAAGPLAIAVTVLNARRSGAASENDACVRAAEQEAPDDARRWSLAARVLRDADGGHAPLANRIASWLLELGEYLSSSTPRNPPVTIAIEGSGASACGGQPPPVQVSYGVREAVVLWTLPALLAGEDLPAWSRFGQAVAEPIALLGDLVRLWLDPDARDLRDAALTPLVEAWLEEPSLGACLLRVYAGERASAVRQLEIHSLLASEPYRAHLEQVVRHALASAAHHLPAARVTNLDAAAGEFLDALGHSFRAIDSLMIFRSLLDIRAAPRTLAGTRSARADALRDAAKTDARMAVHFLSESSPWSGSWEVQRFGVFGSEDQPVGQWSVRGLILRALLEMGYDVHDAIAQLLSEIPPGELRYYGFWPEIPPDADDLGLMLWLIVMTDASRDRVETWIPLLLANTDENSVAPAYFHRDPAGRLTTPSGEAWPGGDCNGVRLQLLCGLLAFDAGRFDELIQANAMRVLADSQEGAVTGVYYYDASYITLAFLRFARLYRDKAIDRSLWDTIATAAAATRARIAVRQRLDGGWGSPQRTAFSLQGYAMELGPWAGDADPLLLERGLRYLGEHQLADGSWPAEPLWRVPMKHGREGWHQGRALTTAFCAQALHVALAALARRER